MSNKKESAAHDDKDTRDRVAKESGKNSPRTVDTDDPGTEDHEFLEDMPPEVRSKVKTFLSLQSFSGHSPSVYEPNLNEEHIHKILELKEKSDERKYKDIQQSRKYTVVFALIGVALFVFLTLFLVNKNVDLFKDILKLFIAFAGGMGAGYGLKKYSDQK